MPFNELRRFSDAIQSGKRVTECHQLSNIRLVEFAQGEYTGINCPNIEVMMKHWVIAFLLLGVTGFANAISAEALPGTKKPTYQQWLGWWQTPDQFHSIEILPDKNGQFRIVGNSVYMSYYLDSKQPIPYYNQFGCTAKPHKDKLICDQQWRKGKASYVEMRLMNNYLIVSDHLDDYSNARFGGTYQKYIRLKKR